MIDPQIIRDQVPFILNGTDFDFLGDVYHGKVRDNYIKDGKRILVASDRLSAFDRIITTIPFKGQVLNQISTFWFEKTGHIMPNHVIDTPDPNVVVGEEVESLPIEMVIRGYITGSTTTSLWYNYNEGQRHIYGLDFPDGLIKNQKLPEPIITPTTKAQKGEHDEKITREEILAQGILSEEDYTYLEQKTQELYKFGSELAAQNGVILVDTKYEFGRRADGTIILIDEIHTPDSSRFWIADTYEQKLAAGEEPDNINKEYLRLWLAKQGFIGDGEMPEITDDIRVETAQKYIQAYELITGQEFIPNQGDTIQRIEKNLRNYVSM